MDESTCVPDPADASPCGGGTALVMQRVRRLEGGLECSDFSSLKTVVVQVRLVLWECAYLVSYFIARNHYY